MINSVGFEFAFAQTPQSRQSYVYKILLLNFFARNHFKLIEEFFAEIHYTGDLHLSFLTNISKTPILPQ